MESESADGFRRSPFTRCSQRRARQATSTLNNTNLSRISPAHLSSSPTPTPTRTPSPSPSSPPQLRAARTTALADLSVAARISNRAPKTGTREGHRAAVDSNDNNDLASLSSGSVTPLEDLDRDLDCLDTVHFGVGHELEAGQRTHTVDVDRDDRRAMLSRGDKVVRGRALEDLADLEEQGLLHHRSPVGSGSHSGSGLKGSSGGGESSAVLEKLELELDSRDTGAGLKSKRDKQAFALLVVLYLLQGVPLGLTFGTLPFLLKPHLSYSSLAVFALSTWPYSLKLLWSPIVDAWFVPRWGRRKSWVVPVQGIVGLGLWMIGSRIEAWLKEPTIDVHLLTMVFGSLIFAAATQDIAVDGWALTLLSPPNLSYASTAQTIGLGIGSAMSFTVFLALNSVDFANKYFRSVPRDAPLVTLGAYLHFWAAMYIVVTFWLIFFKHEDPVSANDPDLDVRKVYRIMWSIVRLKNIQSFLFVLLIAKFGFQVNESVTQLKLLEKGLNREDLAVAVLLDFPAQMVVGWLAAKWSRPTNTPPPADEHRHPLSAGPGSAQRAAAATSGVLRVWVGAFWARLAMALVAAAVVWMFPTGKVGSGYFSLVIATTLMTSLTNTVQFVGITAFHTQIADPLIGGTYMTLLNTVSNLGGTWPKPLILRAVDLLTVSTCSATGADCSTPVGVAACTAAQGTCAIVRDGYYVMTLGCVAASASLLVYYILPTVKRLTSLPLSAWRVKIPA